MIKLETRSFILKELSQCLSVTVFTSMAYWHLLHAAGMIMSSVPVLHIWSSTFLFPGQLNKNWN